MIWARRFNVTGRSGDQYVVAVAESGHWGCSCPKWKFAKKGADGLKPDCHHIEAVQANMPKERVDRFAGLDMRAARAKVAAVLEVGSRFAGLEYEVEVAHA